VRRLAEVCVAEHVGAEAEAVTGEATVGEVTGRGAMTASLAPAQQPSAEATDSMGETGGGLGSVQGSHLLFDRSM